MDLSKDRTQDGKASKDVRGDNCVPEDIDV